MYRNSMCLIGWRVVILTILCILANQESWNFSTYTRLPLHIYMNANKHAHVHVHKHAHPQKHRNMSMHACLQTYKHVHTYAHIHTCKYTTGTNMQTFTYFHTYTHIFIQINIHVQWHMYLAGTGLIGLMVIMRSVVTLSLLMLRCKGDLFRLYWKQFICC